ncbi:Hsp33 family molecular chaperone HslO [Solilutibacter tolerans]|uniref:Molecular chaperone Hsp33 n=1 Tax=Solilutibacter tolerans TaxID=1604334 RepID=A0A1N6U4H0_9GAMM|nr:Hsp33 family molecular chaperone HslO [Lysobacter tolerans]SIQ60449.1 molecular chaperone Hsp33 [Lysobacter tolerans]
MSNDNTSAAHGGRLDIFLLPDAGVRGAYVRLDDAWRQIIARNDDPDAVRDLLGQAVAATALLTAHTKVDGRLSVQLRGSGALRSLFAECTGARTVRGLVRLSEDASPKAATAEALDLSQLGGDSVMAITIENPTPSGEPVRYQGLVPLESPTLAGAFENYFRQSEQLPTRLLLAADGQHATGLLLQKLPASEADDDGWNRIEQLFATLGTEELHSVDAATLLHRLFHQENLHELGHRDLQFGCSCSRERVAEVLRSLGREEALAAVEAGDVDGAEVRCEFCGQRYHFDTAQIESLFLAPEPNTDAPNRLQ